MEWTRGDQLTHAYHLAVQLDEMLEKSNSKLTAALEFEIDDEIVLDRLGGRYVHPASGRSYHVKYAPPKVAGKDDVRLLLPSLPSSPHVLLLLRLLVVAHRTRTHSHASSHAQQVTGEPLIQRSDDNPETIKRRLASFHKDTVPVAAYYKKQGILEKLDAKRKPQEVHARVKKIIETRL